MQRQFDIYCKNTDRYVTIDGGDTLADIAQRLADQLPFKPICAHVNNKNESLRYAVFSPKQVEFLPRTSPSGNRVYVRSLCMMLYCAVKRCFPGVGLSIEHSISHGYYCLLHGADDNGDPEAIAAALRDEMRAMTRADIPFRRHERRTADVATLFDNAGLTDKARLLRTTRYLYTTYYTLGDVCDSYYGALAPSTGIIDVFDLQPYERGFLLTAFDDADPSRPALPVSQPKMYKAFTDYLKFNDIIGISNIAQLNESVLADRQTDIINVSEALHEKSIARISDEITRRYHEGGARVVLIAGPSSSGKTTTTKRLAIQLMTNLLNPQMISLDDYFINREHTPLDANGEYDYESLYALDLQKFNTDLCDIIAGREVELPTYNFNTGRREYQGRRLRLEQNSILLIEGIHGLNPELTSQLDEHMKFRLYVSALTTISVDDHNRIPTTDNRLIRRIIRDYKYRGTSVIDTIKRWPGVRRGEEKWIFPFQENADAMFNSSLLFELGVMRREAVEVLAQVPRDCVEYAEAHRLIKFLSHFLPIPVDLVPSTSVLREFLGGSSFKY